MAEKKKTLKNEGDKAIGLYDDKAEAYVLSGMLKIPGIAEVAIDKLRADTFSEIDRLLIFESIKRLSMRNQPLTETSVLTEARIVAGEKGFKDMLTISQEAIEFYSNIDLSATDVRPLISHLARLTASRTVTPAIEQMVQLVSRGAEPDQVRNLIGALLGTIMGTDENRTIIYGEQTVDYFLQILADLEDETKKKKHEVLRWPWTAMNELPVVPLVGGTVGYIVGADKSGKSTMAEVLAEYWAHKMGAEVAYFHTEYTAKFMLARRMARWSGVNIEKILHGSDYAGNKLSAADHRAIDKASEVMRQSMPRLHYVHASGMLMDEVVGQMHTLALSGRMDVCILDYFHDLRFMSVKGGSGEYFAMGEAAKLFHRTLAKLDIPGIVVMRGKKEMLTATELDRSMIEGGSGIIYKNQFTLMIGRRILDADGQDDEFVTDPKTRLHHVVPAGKAGQMSRTVYCKIDSQTMGPTGKFELYQANAYVISDKPKLLDRATAEQMAAAEKKAAEPDSLFDEEGDE